MIFTALILLIAPVLFLRPLRRASYAVHVFIVVASSWWLDVTMTTVRAFSLEAIAYVLILHLVSINVITFILYGYDKSSSRDRYRSRISENTLHLFMLIGGTIGAIVGQNYYRHKTNKVSFRVTFWLIFVIQVVFVTIVGMWQFS